MWKRLNEVTSHGFVREASSSSIALCPSKLISAVMCDYYV